MTDITKTHFKKCIQKLIILTKDQMWDSLQINAKLLLNRLESRIILDNISKRYTNITKYIRYINIPNIYNILCDTNTLSESIKTITDLQIQMLKELHWLLYFEIYYKNLHTNFNNTIKLIIENSKKQLLELKKIENLIL
jgi:hypothetical protein